MGTRGYVDPTGVHEALDERSDAYSLGVVLLRLLTGACCTIILYSIIYYILCIIILYVI